MASACLVTDQIKAPEQPKSPPIITSTDVPVGSIIRFDATSSNELSFPIDIRDEKVDDDLKLRMVIQTSSKDAQPFDCPEKIEIPQSGSVMRNDIRIAIPATKFDKGSCSQIQLFVSADFFPCAKHPNPGWVDVTTDGDNDLGRATFYVWETSADPVTNPAAAQKIFNSCPTVDGATTSSPMTMPMTLGQ